MANNGEQASSAALEREPPVGTLGLPMNDLPGLRS
jgi:hypothetical protein